MATTVGELNRCPMVTTFTKPAPLGSCPHCDAGKPRILETEFSVSLQQYVSHYTHLKGAQGEGFVDCAIQDWVPRGPDGR